MANPDVTIVTTSRGNFYKFSLPPGLETTRPLCFDTGPLAPTERWIDHVLEDGSIRHAPPREAMPATFAKRLLESAIRKYMLVLFEHPENEYDMSIANIGRVMGIVEIFNGPNLGHESMSRMLIYIAVRTEYYDKVRNTKGFSFHMKPPPVARSEEISPTDLPWFVNTRIYVPDENEAVTATPHLFSETLAKNAVRASDPIQSRQDIMSEGTPKNDTAAPADFATELLKTAPVVRFDETAHCAALEEIKRAAAERDQAYAARDTAVAECAKYSQLAINLRQVLTKQYQDTINESALYSSDTTFTALCARFSSKDPIPPNEVAQGIMAMHERARAAEVHIQLRYANEQLAKAREGHVQYSAKRPNVMGSSAAASALVTPQVSSSGVGFRIQGV